MKTVIVMLIITFLINNLVSAQYRVNKKLYDYENYSHQPGDPYSPVAAGLVSTLIPGSGQMLSGEFGRGAAFLGGFIGCFGTMFTGFVYLDDDTPAFLIVESASLTGMIFIWFFSIIDAVHVAKVNNLAYRDKKDISYNFKVQPCLNILNVPLDASIPLGITLKVRF